MKLATNEFVRILRKMWGSAARRVSDIDHFRCVQQSLAPTRIDQDDFEARRRAETAKYERRIAAAQNLYLAGEIEL